MQYQNELVADGFRKPLFAAYEATVSRALIRTADRVMPLSFEHADSVAYLRRLRERRPERIAELPNGVDVEAFSPVAVADEGGRDDAGAVGLRERLGIPADAFVAVFTGTLDRAHHFKRVDLAIDAVAAARTRTHLVVCGGGELLERYRRRATEAGVGERVHFLGSVPHRQLPAVLRESDAFVLTTEPPESFGIVLIEAMACGLPVLATDFPGARAVVADGVDGTIVPSGQAGAVAVALDELAAAGPAARREMGQAGRGKVVERYSWPVLAKRAEAIYRDAIDERGR